jgi:hypothetical protein
MNYCVHWRRSYEPVLQHGCERTGLMSKATVTHAQCDCYRGLLVAGRARRISRPDRGVSVAVMLVQTCAT